MDLGAFELAFEALRFDSCCAVWKDAIRLSKVKNSSATSVIAMLKLLLFYGVMTNGRGRSSILDGHGHVVLVQSFGGSRRRVRVAKMK